jgi:uncharacterized protein (TIGR02145 family)
MSYIKNIAVLSVLTFTVFTLSCKKIKDPKSETSQAVSFTETSITCGGVAYGDKILEYGICWSEYSEPTIKYNKIAVGSGEGNYTTTITGLIPGKEYHVRAYCASRLLLSYGEDIKVTTFATASLTTNYPSEITNTSFKAESNLVYSGQTLLSKGICWSTSPHPTISDLKTNDPLASNTFTSNPTNLDSNATYYYRSYATFNTGTIYGNELLVKTYNSRITDIDGNIYYTVTIGSQTWMAENLKVTHYQNGDPLTYSDYLNWGSVTTGMYGDYMDTPSNSVIYGRFYDGKVATDSRNVAPVGWHVPTLAEWSVLENYLGGAATAGSKMGLPQSVNWSPLIVFNNSSGFSALMAGLRQNGGSPDGGVNLFTYFWTSTPTAGFSQYFCGMSYNSPQLSITYHGYGYGHNIRCIKN